MLKKLSKYVRLEVDDERGMEKELKISINITYNYSSGCGGCFNLTKF